MHPGAIKARLPPSIRAHRMRGPRRFAARGGAMRLRKPGSSKAKRLPFCSSLDLVPASLVMRTGVPSFHGAHPISQSLHPTSSASATPIARPTLSTIWTIEWRTCSASSTRCKSKRCILSATALAEGCPLRWRLATLIASNVSCSWDRWESNFQSRKVSRVVSHGVV